MILTKEFSRSVKLNERIKRELATIIQTEFNELSFGLVTLNRVDISRDLSVADIYFTVINSSFNEKISCANEPDKIVGDAVHWFNKSSAFLRKKLSKKIHTRKIPDLRFRFDNTLVNVENISTLLSSIKNQK